MRPIHLELKEGAIPQSARPFPVPQSLCGTTKKEVQRLDDIDALEWNNCSKWAASSFVQAKKTGDVRILTDFCKLNDAMKRKPFPLPKILESLQHLRRLKFATATDPSMGCHHLLLDEESQKLCTTVSPWGKCRCKRLPMGTKNSPNIFQSIAQDLLGDPECASTHTDDMLVASDGSFEDHLKQVKKVLRRLEVAGFCANV